MRIFLLGSVLAFVATGVMVVRADQPPSDSSVKVYPVGDLIDLGTPVKPIGIPGQPSYESSPPQATPYQPALYVQPAPSSVRVDPTPIGRLAELVRVMSSGETVPHHDTLSLVVRHNEAGHRTVEELLEGLRTAATPTIKVEFRRMFGSYNDLTQEQQNQVTQLFSKSQLSLKDTALLREIDAGPQPTQVVRLVPGRVTNWEDLTHCGRVTATTSSDRKLIQLRLEYYTLEERSLSQTFHVPPAHSIMIMQETGFWLVTPSFIEEGDEEVDTESGHLSKILYRERMFRYDRTVDGVEVAVPVDSPAAPLAIPTMTIGPAEAKAPIDKK